MVDKDESMGDVINPASIQLLISSCFFPGLSQGLRLNHTLLYLSLANNHIGDVGAAHLAQVHLQTFFEFYIIKSMIRLEFLMNLSLHVDTVRWEMNTNCVKAHIQRAE